AGVVLGGADLHGLQFGQGGFAGGGVFGLVHDDELVQQVGPFQDDAAAGGRGGQLPEVAEEFRLEELLAERAVFVVDGLAGELHDGARLDVAPGVDVVADAGGGRAEGLAFAVVVGVDDGDGL